jgi:hypothetical protein
MSMSMNQHGIVVTEFLTVNPNGCTPTPFPERIVEWYGGRGIRDCFQLEPHGGCGQTRLYIRATGPQRITQLFRGTTRTGMVGMFRHIGLIPSTHVGPRRGIGVMTQGCEIGGFTPPVIRCPIQSDQYISSHVIRREATEGMGCF